MIMKKLMLTFKAIVDFFFYDISTVWEQATQVCGECYSMQIPLTGFLSADAANIGATGGTMLRKPNLDELLQIAEIVC
jgi:hypothetical protein